MSEWGVVWSLFIADGAGGAVLYAVFFDYILIRTACYTK